MQNSKNNHRNRLARFRLRRINPPDGVADKSAFWPKTKSAYGGQVRHTERRIKTHRRNIRTKGDFIAEVLEISTATQYDPIIARPPKVAGAIFMQ